MLRLGFTCVAIPLFLLVAAPVRAQRPDPQSLTVVLDGPPVTFAQPGSEPIYIADRPLVAPKVQSEVDKGKADLQGGNFENAQSQFQKAYSAAPGNPEFNFLLGVSLMVLDKLDQADTYLTRSYSIYPQDPATLTAIGMLRAKQSKFDSATRALRAAIGLNRRFYLAHLVLATAFLAENKFSDSLLEAREALKQGKCKAVEANLIVGECLAKLGKEQEAIQSLKEFVKDCPDDPTVKDAKNLMATLRDRLDTSRAGSFGDPPR